MDYTYAGTRASTMAAALLNDTAYERLLGATTLDEGMRVLADTFVAPYLSDSLTLDQTLNKAVLHAKQETSNFTPQPEVISLFWNAYDFYNIAIIRKGELLKLEDSVLVAQLYTYGAFDPHVLLEAYRAKELGRLLQELGSLHTHIESDTNAQSIDLVTEKVYLLYLQSAQENHSLPFLSRYTALRIDLFNALTALRAQQALGATLDSIPFIKGGTVYVDAFTDETQTRNALARLLNVETKDASITEIEKLAQDFLLNWLREEAHDTFTIAPVFYFLHRLLSHVGIIRALIRSAEAGIPESEMRSFIISLG